MAPRTPNKIKNNEKIEIIADLRNLFFINPPFKQKYFILKTKLKNFIKITMKIHTNLTDLNIFKHIYLHFVSILYSAIKTTLPTSGVKVKVIFQF